MDGGRLGIFSWKERLICMPFHCVGEDLSREECEADRGSGMIPSGY